MKYSSSLTSILQKLHETFQEHEIISLLSGQQKEPPRTSQAFSDGLIKNKNKKEKEKKKSQNPLLFPVYWC